MNYSRSRRFSNAARMGVAKQVVWGVGHLRVFTVGESRRMGQSSEADPWRCPRLSFFGKMSLQPIFA